MALNNAVNAQVQGFQSLNTTTGVWTGRTLTPGAGVGITNGNGTGGNPSISSTVFTTWVTTSVNIGLMVPFTGYFCIAPGGALTLNLPLVPAIGDVLEVSLVGATSWTIKQSTISAQIIVGSSATTVGFVGTLAGKTRSDSVRIVCQDTTGIWVVESMSGNLTVF